MSIKLAKNETISLAKSQYDEICVGVNWGAISKGGIFGLGSSKEAVDLDASVLLYDKDNNFLEKVYFGRLSTMGIQHSGDDRTGDTDGDDGLDNEVIKVSLEKLRENVSKIVFILNSYLGHDFGDIPFASIRLYKGTPDRVDEIIAECDLANDSEFAGNVSMVLAMMENKNGTWTFKNFGVPVPEKGIDMIERAVRERFL